MMELKIKIKQDLKLEKVVCNHGFFMMSPNKWNPSTKLLERPLRLADGSSSVMVSISQPHPGDNIIINIQNADTLNVSDQQAIQRQVVRMLRMTNKDEEDLSKFHEMHDEARRTGFGRLFRSPDVFEDIIKSILLCNTTWERTLQMSKALCELQAQLFSVNHNDGLVPQDAGQLTIAEFFRKRKRESRNNFSQKTTFSKVKAPTGNSKGEGNFPSSKELASLSENLLKTHCNVGYRAKFIIGVAEMVEKGRLKLEEIENEAFNNISLSKKLQKLKGIGPFASNNIVMCLGDYRNIPIDSETINHLCVVHGRKKGTEGTARRDVKQVYDKYAPYQCLAYWFEHCDFYEKQLGEEMSNLSPSSYRKVSSSYLSKITQEKRNEQHMTIFPSSQFTA